MYTHIYIYIYIYTYIYIYIYVLFLEGVVVHQPREGGEVYARRRVAADVLRDAGELVLILYDVL